MATRTMATTLRRKLRERDMSQGDLARALGTSSGVVNRWANGATNPELRFALAIEKLLGIPARAWTKVPATSRASSRAATGTDG